MYLCMVKGAVKGVRTDAPCMAALSHLLSQMQLLSLMQQRLPRQLSRQKRLLQQVQVLGKLGRALLPSRAQMGPCGQLARRWMG